MKENTRLPHVTNRHTVNYTLKGFCPHSTFGMGSHSKSSKIQSDRRFPMSHEQEALKTQTPVLVDSYQTQQLPNAIRDLRVWSLKETLHTTSSHRRFAEQRCLISCDDCLLNGPCRPIIVYRVGRMLKTSYHNLTQPYSLSSLVSYEMQSGNLPCPLMRTSSSRLLERGYAPANLAATRPTQCRSAK